MNLKNWNHVARLALLLPLIAAAGCTGSDVLTPTAGSFRLQVEIVNVPPDYRFGNSEGDRARFRILQIEVRPDDPNAVAVLGEGNNMFLLRTPVGINYDVTPKTIWVPDINPPESPPPLTTGTWRVMSVEIGLLNFNDADDPPSELTCQDFITSYRTRDFQPTMQLSDFSDDFRFIIVPEADNQYSLVIDWAAFTEAIQDSWPCFQNCGIDEPWCLEPYSSAIANAIENRVNDFLSFE